MAKKWGKSGKNCRFYFLGLQITVKGDCSHKMIRCLRLGRKAMTNLAVVLQLLRHVWHLWPHGLQQLGVFCPSLFARAHSNSYSLSQWCHPTILSSVIRFSCLQSYPTSGSFPMTRLFSSHGQSIGASPLAPVLPMNIQCWFPLGLTGLISLQFKGFSRVFSSTTVQKHQFFSTQLSSQSNSHIHTWPLEKP